MLDYLTVITTNELEIKMSKKEHTVRNNLISNTDNISIVS